MWRTPGHRVNMPAPPVQLRGQRLVDNVMRAVLDEMASAGYAALSIEAVAARANVNKTTIYRRWPTKLDLVRAAFDCARPDRVLPDTGTLRGDLVALVDEMAHDLTMPGGRAIVGRIMADEGPELAGLLASLHAQASSENAPIIERAIARGELPPGTEPSLILDVLMAANIHFLFLLHAGDVGRRAQLVDLILDGALHGGAVPRREKARAAAGARGRGKRA